MRVGDLLEELRENILHDRSDQVDGNASDRLWSDKTLVRYINEAQRRFCRRALILRDGSTPDVTQVELTAGVDQYALHPSVIAVLSCRRSTDRIDMTRAGHDAFSAYRVPDFRLFDPSTISNLPPGKPLAWSTDEELTADDEGSVTVVNLRLYPAPSSAFLDNLQLRVLRLPLQDLTVDDLEAIPEIPEQHHLEILDWAAYLALRIDDIDAGSSNRAKEFRDSFEDHVNTARKEMMRK